MAKRSSLTTSILLTCAAIGVATGIVGGIAAWVTPVVIPTVPIIYGFVLGAHTIPGIVAQSLLQRPWVAILTHFLAALVGSAMAPQYLISFFGTALLFGGIQELVAAVTRYRVWSNWRYFISAVVIGVVVAVVVAFAAHLATLPVWAQIVYIVVAVLGPVVWTGIALAVGTGLRRAGVGPRARA